MYQISDSHNAEGFVHNMYGEILCPAIEFITETTEEKMMLFWDLIAEGNPIRSKMYDYIKIKDLDEDIDFEEEDE